MKRFLLPALALLLIITLIACSAPAQLQILLDNKEIDTLSMNIGASRSLSTNIPQGAAWQSSDETVVKITSSGKISALKEGTVTVTLTADGKTDRITVTVAKEPVVWTIGDSIFDFNDNSDHEAIPTMLRTLGYTNYCLDNIGGATICAGVGNGNSIQEHIQSGLYQDFLDKQGTPDLIILFRGTNDIYLRGSHPEQFAAITVEQTLQNVCNYFSTSFPNTRIVWATPMWRLGIDEGVMKEFRNVLHTTCKQHGIEVFDLHLQEPFASLNEKNYKDVLSDGVHPTYVVSFQMGNAFVKYLTGK